MIEMTACKNQDALLEVNPDLLQEYWLHFLRCTGPDLFEVKRFTADNKEDVLQRGWMPRGIENVHILNMLLEKARSLDTFMSKCRAKAYLQIRRQSDFAEFSDVEEKFYCIFCKCSEGIIGVGWRVNDGDLTKAKMLAGFTLYCYGLMSARNDPKLWEVAYRHLPFAVNLDVETADKLFVKYLAC